MDLTLDLALATQAFVTLIVIMDPLGTVPVFLALTSGEDHRTRQRTATHALVAATVLIYVFAFFGTQILASLSIGLPALQAGGGVVLFLVALQMLNGDIMTPSKSEGVSVAIVPLGIPMLAGPGANQRRDGVHVGQRRPAAVGGDADTRSAWRSPRSWPSCGSRCGTRSCSNACSRPTGSTSSPG